VGSKQRAEMYKWLMYLTNTIQAEFLTYFYGDRLTDDDAATAQVKAHAEVRLNGMFQIMDDALKESGGPYLLGETYSIIDPYLMMVSRWGRGLGKAPNSYPHIGPFLDRMAERPAVKRTFEGEGIEAPWY
jgi:glutathione S-transferase